MYKHVQLLTHTFSSLMYKPFPSPHPTKNESPSLFMTNINNHQNPHFAYPTSKSTHHHGVCRRSWMKKTHHKKKKKKPRRANPNPRRAKPKSMVANLRWAKCRPTVADPKMIRPPLCLPLPTQPPISSKPSQPPLPTHPSLHYHIHPSNHPKKKKKKQPQRRTSVKTTNQQPLRFGSITTTTYMQFTNPDLKKKKRISD